MPDAKNRPIAANDEAAMSRAGDVANLHRCAVCRHVITARASIESGIGRDCRRKLRRDRAVLDVLTSGVVA